tara:strand:+ start:272 stop:532 length:261 start_codon:yes stop_codon:yes gene_type:complete
MFGYLTSAVKSATTKVVAVAAVGIATIAAPASATPPAMDPVVFPIDVTSIGTEVAAAGGTMIGVWATVYIGFKLARKLIRRTSSGV